MNRKYPMSFFIIGLLQNLVKYAFIGLISAILLIIGFLGVDICKIIGTIILAVYFLLCVIEQIFIRSAIIKESDNPEFNKFMDQAFGFNDDDNAISTHQKIVKIVEDKIISQDSNLDN